MDLEMQLGKRGAPRARRDQTGARRFLVLGDFGGRQSREILETGDALAARPLTRVRQERFDAAVAAVAPRVALSAALAGAGTRLEIASLEDLHPDALFRRLAVFREPAREPARTPAPVGVVPIGDGDADDLARLLGRRPAPTASPSSSAVPTAVDSLIGQIFSAAPGAPPPGSEAPVDVAPLERAMRTVLREPHLQALEASWRALEILVSRVDEEVEIWLLDVSKPELAVDLLAGVVEGAMAGAEVRAESGPENGLEDGGVEQSGLGRRLLAAPGGRPWAALIGDFAFGPGAADVALLDRLGALAARLGAPFLASAAPALVGCRSLADHADPARWPALVPEDAARWQALRRGPRARWIGLTLPRFLARAPYGAPKKTPGAVAIEAFAFEEIDGNFDPDALPWASAAFLCALELAQGEGAAGDIDDLPFFSVRGDDGVEMYPTAEVFWGQRAADAVLARGLMPVLCARDRNAVRLVRLQSIADPPSALGTPSAFAQE